MLPFQSWTLRMRIPCVIVDAFFSEALRSDNFIARHKQWTTRTAYALLCTTDGPLCTLRPPAVLHHLISPTGRWCTATMVAVVSWACAFKPAQLFAKLVDADGAPLDIPS